MAGVVWVYITPNSEMVVFDELALQGHTVSQVADAIKHINLKHGKDVGNQRVPISPRAYIIDPAARNVVHQTGRSDQMEFIDHGIVTIAGQNAIPAGINRVKERLQNGKLKIMANCPVLIDEFEKYRWTKSRFRTEDVDDAKEAPVKTEDHLLDALRYVLMARPAAPDIREEVKMTPLEKAVQEDIEGKRSTIPMIEGIPLLGAR